MPFVVVNGIVRHYGIPGMKWGRRRYQNPDGSLTAAGKLRYRKLVNRDIVRSSRPSDTKRKVAEDFKNRFPKEHANLVEARDALFTMHAIRDELDVRGSEEYKREHKALKDAVVSRWSAKGVSVTNYSDLERLNDADRKAYSLDINAAAEESYSRASDALMAKRGYDNVRAKQLKDAYDSACRDAVNALVGEFGNTPVTLWNVSAKPLSVQRTSETVDDYILSAIKRDSFANFWYEGWGEKPSDRKG